MLPWTSAYSENLKHVAAPALLHIKMYVTIEIRQSLVSSRIDFFRNLAYCTD